MLVLRQKDLAVVPNPSEYVHYVNITTREIIVYKFYRENAL